MNIDWGLIILAIITGAPGLYAFAKTLAEAKKIKSEAAKTDADAEHTQVETAGLLNKQAMELLESVRADAKLQLDQLRKSYDLQRGELEKRLERVECKLAEQTSELGRERNLRQKLEGKVRDQQNTINSQQITIDRLVEQVKQLGGTPKI